MEGWFTCPNSKGRAASTAIPPAVAAPSDTVWRNLFPIQSVGRGQTFTRPDKMFPPPASASNGVRRERAAPPGFRAVSLPGAVVTARPSQSS